MKFTLEGERGDVTPLGLVAEEERCRDNTLGWETFADAARVGIVGVEGDATKINNIIFQNKTSVDIQGEVIFSLGVDGEITETAPLPAPGPFEAVALAACGTISISYSDENKCFSDRLRWIESYI